MVFIKKLKQEHSHVTGSAGLVVKMSPVLLPHALPNKFLIFIIKWSTVSLLSIKSNEKQLHSDIHVFYETNNVMIAT